MTMMLSVDPSMTHVAIVHFSSPDSRTGILLNLMDKNTYFEIQQAINSLNIDQILGITDLDL